MNDDTRPWDAEGNERAVRAAVGVLLRRFPYMPEAAARDLAIELLNASYTALDATDEEFEVSA